MAPWNGTRLVGFFVASPAAWCPLRSDIQPGGQAGHRTHGGFPSYLTVLAYPLALGEEYIHARYSLRDSLL
jgi:hypothetical protein